MKNITESLSSIQDITPYIQGERVDEGLKDLFKLVKSKFKSAFQYLKGIVVKFGTYFVPVNDKGEILPAITPPTAGAAYVNGLINKDSTFVKMDNEGARISGCKTKLEDVYKLYSQYANPLNYWRKFIKEGVSNEYEYNFVNEDIDEAQLHTTDPQAKYNIIVDDVKLRETIMRYINNPQLSRLMIWGAPGIGKTAILTNIVKTIRKTNPNYKLICKTLSNETPDNFTLPSYIDIETPNGGTERRAEDVPKTWLPVYKPSGDPLYDEELDEQCGSGLLFIDELSRATQQVLNVILPLINEGNINGYKIGSKWTIIVASNRMEDEDNGSQARIGNALANRFGQVHYEPTVHSWRKWADKQGFMSPLLLQWLSMPESEQMSGGKFYYFDPNHNNDSADESTLMATPRSWTNAMQLVATYVQTYNDQGQKLDGDLSGFKICSVPRDILRDSLNMYVPSVAADAFISFLEVIEKIGDFDQAVYDVWQNGGKNFKLDKKDLNKVSLPVAQLICNAHSRELPTQQEWDNLCNWLCSQSSDQLASYVLDIFKNIFLSELPESARDYFFWMRQFQDETFERLGIAPGGVPAPAEKKRGRPRKDAGVANANMGDLQDEDYRQIKTGEAVYNKLCSKWGVNYYDLPDYSAGLTRLGEVYGEAFNTAVVGHHTSALG